MAAALMVHRPGAPPEEVALAGPISAGGGPRDAVRIAGTAPRVLALAPSAAGVVVEALAAGAVFRPGSGPARSLPPGRRRLLLAGDSLLLADAVIEAPSRAPGGGTRVLAGRLLEEAGRGDQPVAGPYLLALEGPDAGRRLSLAEEATLGRGRGATLRLGDAGASRRHARVTRAGRGFALEDLGSKNGLRLNGSPVGRAPAALRPGDHIAFGESVLALVLPGDGPAGPAPPPTAGSGAAVPVRPAGAPPGPPRPWVALAASAALLALAAALAATALGA